MKIYPQMVDGKLIVQAARVAARMIRRNAAGIALFVAFVATVVVANWLVAEYGIVRVGFGLQAPAGVFVVGIAFSLRDVLQDLAGKIAVILAIAVGALISFNLENLQTIAIASAAAFAASESVDFLIYTALHRRSWLAAAALSNAVGLVIDSVVFLTLAFHSLEFLEGQVVAKAYMTAIAIVATGWGRRAVLSRNSQDALA